MKVLFCKMATNDSNGCPRMHTKRCIALMLFSLYCVLCRENASAANLLFLFCHFNGLIRNFANHQFRICHSMRRFLWRMALRTSMALPQRQDTTSKSKMIPNAAQKRWREKIASITFRFFSPATSDDKSVFFAFPFTRAECEQFLSVQISDKC